MYEKRLPLCKKQFYQLVGLELLGLSLMSAITWIFYDIKITGSFFIGGMACLVPNAYQAKKFFKEVFARNAAKIVTRLYYTELLKFVVIAVLFILLMRWHQFSVLAFVVGFLLTTMGGWLVLSILMIVKR